jgi:hypothetical protein
VSDRILSRLRFERPPGADLEHVEGLSLQLSGDASCDIVVGGSDPELVDASRTRPLGVQQRLQRLHVSDHRLPAHAGEARDPSDDPDADTLAADLKRQEPGPVRGSR